MSRDIKLLCPKLQEIIKKMQKADKTFGISQTFRTKSEQDTLYSQGRTSPGNIVTNAKFPYSAHCWGIAFDFYRNDGNGAYNDFDGYFQKIGQLGESLGLEWGGRWSTFPDKPHLQLRDFSIDGLIAKYKTPENFIKTWEVRKVIENAEEAIKILNEKGIISSPEYWQNAVKCIKNLDALLINMANAI